MRLVIVPLFLTAMGCGRLDDSTATRPTTPRTTAQPQDREQITKNLLAQAEEIGRVALVADHERMADMMHPAMVRQMGGREKCVRRLGEIEAEMKGSGFRFVDVKSGPPVALVEAGGKWYGIVPCVLHMSGPDGARGRVESHNIGESTDGGRTWRFVDSNGLKGSRKLVKWVMPDFPDSLPLPAEGRTVWEDN